MFKRLGVLRNFQFPRSITSELQKTLWLTRFRWLAIGLAAFMTGPAIATGLLAREHTPFYIGTIGLIFMFNLMTQLVWSPRQSDVNPTFIGFQLAFDLFTIGALLFLTGGWANPFLPLLFLHVMLGAVLIREWLSIPFLVLAHAILLALQIAGLEATAEAIATAGDTQHNIGAFAIGHLIALCFWGVGRSLGAHFEYQQQAQKASQQRDERLQRLRAIGALAAGFAHEFSSPLQAARIRIERALRISDSPQTAELIEARLAIDSCAAIIRAMNSSQLDSTQHIIKRVPIDHVLKDIAESWHDENPSAKIKLDLTANADIDLSAISLAQAVINILDNAYESAPAGTITLRSYSDSGHLLISIEDEGPGFAAPIDRFGAPFFTTKPDGTGLGLYVSSLFAQSTGGSIGFSNLSNGGAQVSFRLPHSEAKT